MAFISSGMGRGSASTGLYWTKHRMLSDGMPLRPLHIVTQRENKDTGEHTSRVLCRDVEASLSVVRLPWPGNRSVSIKSILT